MALVSTSQVVLDQSATPITKVNSLEKGGVVRTAQGFLAAASYTGGTVGQWYTFVRIPLRARVLSVRMTQATTTTGATAIGLYRPDGVVIDADAFAAVNVSTGQIRAEAATATVFTPALRRQSLRDGFAAALTAAGAQDDVEVDLAHTIVTVTGTPTDALMEVDYVLPE
jgi:hypothetical protein